MTRTRGDSPGARRVGPRILRGLKDAGDGGEEEGDGGRQEN